MVAQKEDCVYKKTYYALLDLWIMKHCSSSPISNCPILLKATPEYVILIPISGKPGDIGCPIFLQMPTESALFSPILR